MINGLTISVSLFAFNEYRGLKRLVPKILRSNVDQIIISYGGNDESDKFLRSLEDSRLELIYEKKRIGKRAAVNYAMGKITGDIVFQISADIDFEQVIFEKCCDEMTDEVGVVVPNVIPIKLDNFAKRLGSLLWHLEDVQKDFYDRLEENNHGGEFLAIRAKLIEPIPQIVNNDDGFVCANAKKKGFKVKYLKNYAIYNTPPGCIRELILQRERVVLAHIEMVRIGLPENVLDTLIWSNRLYFSRIMHSFILRYPRDLPFLPLLVFVELVAHFLARFRFDRNSRKSSWDLLSSAKL